MTDLNASCLGLLNNPRDIIILLVVVLLLFGGKKLPELARGLARGMRIFRDELHGVKKDLETPPPEEEMKPQLPPKDQAAVSGEAKQKQEQS